MTANRLWLARASLVLLWWGTVAASLHDGGAAGVLLLQQTTALSADTAHRLVLLGSGWDAAIGLLILLRPGALTYRIAAAGVVAMTALATVLLPTLWLDPFGPFLKNLPVLALLALLERPTS
jgi:hypothetical protein